MTRQTNEYADGTIAFGVAPLPEAPNALGNRRAAFGASELTDGLAGKT